MWKLFNNSPARRDLYINLNRSYNFSLMFCQMRCVEDKSVASRATGVWKLVVSVINHCKSLSKSKCPENKSYDLLVKHMTNNLMLMKFQFFKDSVSTKFYLTKFQTDAQNMPFRSGLLVRNLGQVMKMFFTCSFLMFFDQDRSWEEKKFIAFLTLLRFLLLLNHFWFQLKFK